MVCTSMGTQRNETGWSAGFPKATDAEDCATALSEEQHEPSLLPGMGESCELLSASPEWWVSALCGSFVTACSVSWPCDCSRSACATAPLPCDSQQNRASRSHAETPAIQIAMHPAAIMREVSGSFVWRCIMRLFVYATPMEAPLLWGIVLTADCEWMPSGIIPQRIAG